MTQYYVLFGDGNIFGSGRMNQMTKEEVVKQVGGACEVMFVDEGDKNRIKIGELLTLMADDVPARERK